MIKKRILRTTSAQLIYQAAINEGIDARIESSRFNLFSMILNGNRVFVKGTNLPINSQTSCLIANNKFLSKKIFRQRDIATPKSWLVNNTKKAQRMIIKKDLFPCVIKPINGAHGNEVYANIQTQEELQGVVSQLESLGRKNLLIEEYINGVDYRLLVVGSKVVAVTERIPAHVIGDGVHTIAELITLFNKDPRIGKKYEKPMCKILKNFELSRSLKKQRIKLTTVLPLNYLVHLKQNANISAGGISKDVTHTIDKQIEQLAIRTAKAIGMEYCGVDIMFDPITTKAYVLEVNDCPGIDIHHFPVVGKSQNVAKEIVLHMKKRFTEDHVLMYGVNKPYIDRLVTYVRN